MTQSSTGGGLASGTGAPVRMAFPPYCEDCGGGGGGGGGGSPVITAEERYPGAYHDVEVGVVARDLIFLGPQKLATLNNGTTLFFTISDHLGSSSIVTSTTGTPTEYRDFRPFGTATVSQVIQDSKNDFRFTGKELDSETALQYFGARYLDNQFARFQSVDPFLLRGADLPRVLADPQQLNSYSYARGNPLILIDQDGNRSRLAQAVFSAVSSAFFSIPGIKQFEEYVQNNAARASNLSTSVVPIVGDIQDLREAATGRAAYTGEQLSPTERVISGVLAAAPVVSGSVVRHVAKSGDEFITLYHGSKLRHQEILEKGLPNKTLFFSTDPDAALKYSQIKADDPLNFVRLKIPRDQFDSFMNKGLLKDVTYSNSTDPFAREYLADRKIVEDLNKFIDR